MLKGAGDTKTLGEIPDLREEIFMGILNRAKRRKNAFEKLTELFNNSSHTLIVHYSCESFYDIKDGRTPRITSIAVRYLNTAQTKSFSIHKTAEINKVPFDKIEEDYDRLEKEMLTDFFTLVKNHNSFNWIHWNMRDINYGFEAIEHRYSVLGGIPESISDSNKFDLSRLLIDIFGRRYIGHPRLESLMNFNKITKKDFLTGAEEAQAFENKEYVKLHQSTLRKVDIFQTILERTVEKALKTNAKLSDMYGISPQGIADMIKENWLLGLIWTVLTIVIGAVIGSLLT